MCLGIITICFCIEKLLLENVFLNEGEITATPAISLVILADLMECMYAYFLCCHFQNPESIWTTAGSSS